MKNKRQIKIIPEHREFLMKTTDDFCPNFKKDLVQVSFSSCSRITMDGVLS